MYSDHMTCPIHTPTISLGLWTLFQPVGAALIWAVSDSAGESWTDEVNDAWVTLYGMVTYRLQYLMETGMKDAAEKPAAEKQRVIA